MNNYNRKLIGVYMDWLVHANAKIGYRQLRPMTTRNVASALDLEALLQDEWEMDCSESVTLLCHLAGLRPPSGIQYGYGYGNTVTLLQHLPRLSHPSDMNLGDLVVFAADQNIKYQHVAAVRTPGSDPRLFSHGTPKDPSFWRLSAGAPSFRGHPAYLSIGGL